MCNSKQIKVGVNQIADRFSVSPGEVNPLFEPSLQISAFDHPYHPIITTENPEVLSTTFRWGLVPPDWRKEPKEIWNYTNNAKLEHLNQKYAWSKVTANRCIIPVTAYFEYHWNDPKGKSKTKYIIQNKDEEIFALAGLYSMWISPTGEHLNTYTVCTTKGNDTMKFVHNKNAHKNYFRMPVMLNRSDEKTWLDPNRDYLDFAYPNYKPGLIAFPADANDAPQLGLF